MASRAFYVIHALLRLFWVHKRLDPTDRHLGQPLWSRNMQRIFEEGYVAGWQSVRGPKDVPLNVPLSPVVVVPGAYMVGFSRGLRDATAMNDSRTV
jgi:hypothetical protein